MLVTNEKQRSWPSKLANLLESEVINGAFGGSSLEEIGCRTILNLSKLQQQNKKVDLCLVGLTSFDRILTIRRDWSKFDNNDIEYYYSWMYSLISSWHHDNNLAGMEPANFVKSWILLNDDCTEIIKFLLEMIKIKLSVKSLLGKNPIFLPVYHMIPDMLDAKMKCSNTMMNIISMSGINDIDPELEFSEVGINYQKLVCGHFSKLAHQEYAHVIYKYLKENKYVE